MIAIGPYKLANRVALAPMAGITDLPFRRLCRRLGAGLVVSEMITSDSRLWQSNKSRLRLRHHQECEPRSVQITGGDPQMMAAAALESDTFRREFNRLETAAQQLSQLKRYFSQSWHEELAA